MNVTSFENQYDQTHELKQALVVLERDFSIHKGFKFLWRRAKAFRACKSSK